jgi:hypothetical protein
LLYFFNNDALKHPKNPGVFITERRFGLACEQAALGALEAFAALLVKSDLGTLVAESFGKRLVNGW